MCWFLSPSFANLKHPERDTIYSPLRIYKRLERIWQSSSLESRSDKLHILIHFKVWLFRSLIEWALLSHHCLPILFFFFWFIFGRKSPIYSGIYFGSFVQSCLWVLDGHHYTFDNKRNIYSTDISTYLSVDSVLSVLYYHIIA